MRTVTIADQHSKNSPEQALTVEMSGGDPWYAYVWVDDVMHLVTRDDDTGIVEIHPHH